MKAALSSLNLTEPDQGTNKLAQKIRVIPAEGSKNWNAKIVFTEGSHTLIRLKTDVDHIIEYKVERFALMGTGKVFLDGNVVSSDWALLDVPSGTHKFIIPDDSFMYDATLITTYSRSRLQITLVVAGQVLLQEATAPEK